MVPSEPPDCLDERVVSAFVAGELSTTELPRIETHLAHCARCQRAVGELANAYAGGTFAPGSVLADKYRIEESLGRGGMGEVFAAVHLELGHRVAIKVLRGFGGPSAGARLLREAQACARLVNDHIVRVFDFGWLSNGEPYIVMEHLLGEDLARVLARGPIPVADAVSYALQVCTALATAHAAGVVHRDIKPANLFLTQRADASHLLKVLDFGLSKFMAEPLSESPHVVTSPGTFLGSPQYMSPEQIRGATDLDARTDIWSLGVVLYELLAGRPPFRARSVYELSVVIATEAPPPLSEYCPGLPAALEAIVGKCLEKDPALRFSSAQALAEALASFNSPAFASFASLAAAEDAPRHNLPAQTTPFVGRVNELAELARLFGDPESRLLTIVAPGGMGKSRLALEAVRRLLAGASARGETVPSNTLFPNGIFVVQLAPLSSPEFIVSAIALVLRFQFYPGGEPKQQLLDYFRDKKLLLVLDNFEHLLVGASIVSDILEAAAGVKVLTTTRERLNLSGETVLALSGLDFADWGTLQEGLDSGSGQLLIQSARRVRPDFELKADDLPATARICHLVQGMPLGILLAAAWLDVLSLQEIAHELGQNTDLLATELKDVPERQRSLQAVFDYSWRSLTEQERLVFSRLSVFRGGFTREAAEAVAQTDLRTLAALLKKSLLRRDPGTNRYEIHELLLQYAEARLNASPSDLEQALDLHSGYFAEFLRARQERIDAELRSHAMTRASWKATLDEMSAELDNVRRAWDYMLKHMLARDQLGNLEQAIEGVSRMFWHRSSVAKDTAARQFRDAEATFRAAVRSLESHAGAMTSERAKTLGVALYLQAQHLPWEQAEEKLELLHRALTFLEQDRHPRDRARVLLDLGSVQVLFGQGREGLANTESGLALCRQLGTSETAEALACLRDLHARLGNTLEAEKATRECIALEESQGTQHGVSTYALCQRGKILVARGNAAEGCWLFAQALAVFEQVGNVSAERSCLSAMADAHARLGNYPLAEAHLRRALSLTENGGHQMTEAGFRIELGILLKEGGQLTEATNQFKKALALGQKLESAELKGWSLQGLAEVESMLGNHALAETYTRRRFSLGKVSFHQEMWGALSLGNVLRDQGRYDEAEGHCRAAYERSTGSGETRLVASARLALGELAALRGKRAEANELLEGVFGDFEALGDARRAAHAISSLGYVACVEGDFVAAARYLRRLLEVLREGKGLRAGEARVASTWVLAGIALLFAKTQQAERAVELLALLRNHAATEPNTRVQRIEPLLSELKGALDPETFAAAFARGEALDLESTLRSVELPSADRAQSSAL